MVLIVLLALLLPVLAVPNAHPVTAQDSDEDEGQRGHGPPEVLILVDVSGSMNETDPSGGTRLEGAKTALIDFVEAMPSSSRVGLWTYPQPTNSSIDSGCSVGGPIIGGAGLEPTDPAPMAAAIRGLTADGNTPTGPALREAAMLFSSSGSRTVVLVSDGEHNCGEDPCDVAADLARDEVDTTIHSVGFQISSAGEESLQCIADVGRGTYISMDDSDELIERLPDLAQASLEVSVAAPEVVEPASDPSTSRVPVTATVTNTSTTEALNVQAMLSFSADDSPGAWQPRRRLGNLEPEESRTVVWEFPIPFDFTDRVVRLRVGANAINSERYESEELEVLVTGDLDLARAGPLLADRSRALILGDSFSSGEGAGDYQPGTDVAGSDHANLCHRSANTYVAVVDLLDTLNVACSGAISAHLYTADHGNNAVNGQGSLPGQIYQARSAVDGGEVWEGEPPDVALLTAGGNDVGFATIITLCIVSDAFWSIPCPVLAEPFLRRKMRDLPGSLRSGYLYVDAVMNRSSWIDRRGPAPILVLGYPQIVPPPSAVSARCSNPVSLLNDSRIALGSLVWAGLMAPRINEIIETEVTTLRNEGYPIYFVDMERALAGRTICDEDPWVNVLTLSDLEVELDDLGSPFQAFPGLRQDIGRHISESFHPNADGYRAMTAALLHWSRTDPSATPPDPAASRPDPISLSGDDGTLEVRVSSGDPVSLQPNSSYQLQASELPPGQLVDVRFESTPFLLARGLTDPDGVLETEIVVPDTATEGRHDLLFEYTVPDEELEDDEQVLIATVEATVSSPGSGVWSLLLGTFGLLSVFGGWHLRRRGGMAVQEERDSREAALLASRSSREWRMAEENS